MAHAVRTSRHQTVFSVFKPADDDGEDKVVFKQVVDEGEEYHAFVMQGNTFRELGEPLLITVTVEPGDTLNDVADDVPQERWVSRTNVQPPNASER